MKKPKPTKAKTNQSEETKPQENGSVEQRLLDCLVEPLRTTDQRKRSLAATGKSDEVVEQALASPAVLGGIAKAQNAFVVEHWPTLLRKLFDAAAQGESWAWKILLDVAGVAEQLRAACAGAGAGAEGSESELGLPKEIRALLSRADEEAEISDSVSSAE